MAAKKSKIGKLKNEVSSHLKKDTKTFKEEIKDDKKLMKKMKKL